MAEIPAGFSQLSVSSPFVNHVGPFYVKEGDRKISIGLRIEEKHCNSSKRAHGGLVSTLADITLGKSLGYANLLQGKMGQIVTVNLTTDFAGAAKLGDWVEMEVDIQRVGKVLMFANAYMLCNGERVARSSGVYRQL